MSYSASEIQRLDLADLIRDSSGADWFSGTPLDSADAVLHAGYRKPRTITTVEELGALPVRSVILSTGNGKGMSVTKRTNDEPAGLDYFTAGNPMGYAVGEIPLPATVLYEPEAHHAD